MDHTQISSTSPRHQPVDAIKKFPLARSNDMPNMTKALIIAGAVAIIAFFVAPLMYEVALKRMVGAGLFDKDADQVCDGKEPSIDKIEEHIFIGDMCAANDLATLQKYEITNVLNACATCPPALEEHLEGYKQIPLIDKNWEDIETFFDEANAFIEGCVSRGQNVLIHCVGGRSRSAALVIAHLMYKHNWPLDRALKVVEHGRSQTDINTGFVQQLKKLEDKIKTKISAATA
eukprot:TRINITY_DN5356_c0_g1_i1.p1 TRINITY_DN5356_c0_g1~~TRINITY_DN5356_c0_g1_i1.p1  ORF type:complete len:252 (+),score=83.47 TRINITY_DN5356_c0_g1_i1:61-756(+)